MKIENSVIWVVGGTSGIGEGLTELLISKGAKVCISGRNTVAGEAIAQRLGENCIYAKADITVVEELKAAAQAVIDKWGRMDALINTAAYNVFHKLFDENGDLCEDDIFRRHIDVNLIGSYDVARIAAYHIKKNQPNPEAYGERGCIILTSSLSALSNGGADQFGYKTSKTAIAGLMRTLALSLGPLGIRCNTLAPGFIKTPMTLDPMANPFFDLTKDIDIPSHVFPPKVGLPIHCANAVVHLLENVFINKVELSVDAGSMSRL